MFVLLALVGALGGGSAVAGSCGQTPIAPVLSRIVGGQTAKPYSWPWQVEFAKKGWWGYDLMCGGSIIGKNWIMTAGHCVYGSTNSPGKFLIKAGVFAEAEDNENGELLLKIAKIYLHPQYNHKSTAYDIALLKLESPIPNWTDHIQPVCLPSPSSDTPALQPGNTVYVTGWGATSEGGSIAKNLQQVLVPVLSQGSCDKDYPGEILDSVMFCCGKAGKDSCQGDSGGPLVAETSGKWFQHGIVSWGYGCAEPNYPGVYSKVSAYCNWIASTTSNAAQCQ